jgi:hypothetical protein
MVYLAVQAAYAPSARFFSMLPSKIITNKHNRLNHTMAGKMLLCLRTGSDRKISWTFIRQQLRMRIKLKECRNRSL